MRGIIVKNNNNNITKVMIHNKAIIKLLSSRLLNREHQERD